jgi:cytochrome oxidase Cu insertion factor (SCO1/SenC/PrrC family)
LRKVVIIIVAGALLLIGGGMFFSTRKVSLNVGDHAPDFLLTDQNGSPVKLSDFRGKKSVVLAFYIKAFTPG